MDIHELSQILKVYNTLDEQQHASYSVDNTEQAQDFLRQRVEMEYQLAHYGLVFGWSSDLQLWGLFPQDRIPELLYALACQYAPECPGCSSHCP